MELFDKAFNITLNNEGGFSNDKYDPGGATKYGITEETLKQYDASLNIRSISKDTAKHIYKTNYWTKAHCDEIAKINNSLAILLFDSGVNIGIKTSTKILQTTINAFYHYPIAVDGYIGQKTLFALNLCILKNKESFLDAYIAGWRCHYITLTKNNDKLKKFINGWMNRVRKTVASL